MTTVLIEIYLCDIIIICILDVSFVAYKRVHK